MKEENVEELGNISECETGQEFDEYSEENVEIASNEENGDVMEKGLVKTKRSGTKGKKGKNKIKILIIVLAIFFVLVAIIAGFAIINKFNTNVYNNVHLRGKDMSGMTMDQVKEYVVKIYDETMVDVSVDIFQGDKLLEVIDPSDIELNIDVDETINQVFEYGRNGNIFVDNFNILNLMFGKKDFEFVYTYDAEKLKITEDSIRSAIEEKVVNDSFELDEKEHKLIIIRGHAGNDLDSEKYKEDILKLLKDGKTTKYEVAIKKSEPTLIDVDKVYLEVKRDAEDAKVVQASGQKPVFKAEVYGYDFDKNDLKAVLEKTENKEPDKKIVYDLKVTEPKVKYKDIAWSAYESRLGGLTTYFPASNYNRAKNVQIGLSYLNGVVIMPGETFSFNKTLGDITAAKGYLPAATFKGGTVVDEVGGGICQTVSTLYNAALYANLEIVTRYQHGLAVGYVPPSLDATMYYPSLDFKFKNNRNYPIKIVTSFSSNGSMNISIYGTKEETEYEIVLTSNVLSYQSYTTKYIDDPTLPAGKEVVKVGGVNGYTSESRKITKLNGKVIKNELLTRDTYKPTTKMVRRGTGGSVTPPTNPSSSASSKPSSSASASNKPSTSTPPSSSASNKPSSSATPST